MGINQYLDGFCNDEISKINTGKKTRYDDEYIGEIAALVTAITELTIPVMMRELSVSVLKDSKRFERDFIGKVCYVLSRYGPAPIDLNLNNKEDVAAFLEEKLVLKNPAYVYFNGAGKITFKNGKTLNTDIGYHLSLPATAVKDIQKFEICSNNVLTVENLQVFNRIPAHDRFVVYIAGYHAKALTDMLTRITHKDQCDIKWFHFGDYDPDGFQILKVLRNKTGLDFKPYLMDADTISRYIKECKTLTLHDVDLAITLQIRAPEYAEELGMMLNYNIKLEQERIAADYFC